MIYNLGLWEINSFILKEFIDLDAFD